MKLCENVKSKKKLYSKPGCQFWYLYNYVNCTRWNILWNRNKFLNVIRLGITLHENILEKIFSKFSPKYQDDPFDMTYF